jgi:primosomal protein N' (replication factor Y)
VSRFVAVAVPVPALDLLTYRVPDGLPMPVAGARVDVPLGPRTLTGIAVVPDTIAPPATVTVRDVVRVRDDAPFLPPAVAALAQWVAEYYLAGPGDAMATALPPRVLTGDQATFRAVRVVTLTAQGHDVAARLAEAPPGATPEGAPRLGSSQREALGVLRGMPLGVPAPALATRGIGASVVTRLTQLGLVSVRREKVERDPFGAPGTVAEAVGEDLDRVHSSEQAAALWTLRGLADQGTFHVALLHGVTGSGKTEVYLHLAEHVRRGGRPALMLVPEIGLTPAVAARFRARFGERVAIQHSGLSDGERHDQWHRIRDGAVDVVVGTRSAVFAPLTRPGLIIVDEEHETSYKQEESPRYHGRDVAVMRGKMEGALVVLGSATPSLESYENAQTHRYTLVRLRRRVLDRPLARVQVVNMRTEFAEAGAEVVLSRVLLEGLTERLARREQSVVLLNRRGFATAVFCRQCAASGGPAAMTATTSAWCRRPARPARRRTSSTSATAPSGWSRRSARRCRRRASAGSTATRWASAVASRRCSTASRGASSTSSSARR